MRLQSHESLLEVFDKFGGFAPSVVNENNNLNKSPLSVASVLSQIKPKRAAVWSDPTQKREKLRMRLKEELEAKLDRSEKNRQLYLIGVASRAKQYRKTTNIRVVATPHIPLRSDSAARQIRPISNSFSPSIMEKVKVVRDRQDLKDSERVRAVIEKLVNKMSRLPSRNTSNRESSTASKSRRAVSAASSHLRKERSPALRAKSRSEETRAKTAPQHKKFDWEGDMISRYLRSN
jgi:hypothetical protein